MQAYRVYAKSFTTKQGRMNRVPKCKVIFEWALRVQLDFIIKNHERVGKIKIFFK
jgi:hypothetical protein